MVGPRAPKPKARARVLYHLRYAKRLGSTNQYRGAKCVRNETIRWPTMSRTGAVRANRIQNHWCKLRWSTVDRTIMVSIRYEYRRVGRPWFTKWSKVRLIVVEAIWGRGGTEVIIMQNVGHHCSLRRYVDRRVCRL